jgi:hypothetical protein
MELELNNGLGCENLRDACSRVMKEVTEVVFCLCHALTITCQQAADEMEEASVQQLAILTGARLMDLGRLSRVNTEVIEHSTDGLMEGFGPKSTEILARGATADFAWLASPAGVQGAREDRVALKLPQSDVLPFHHLLLA